MHAWHLLDRTADVKIAEISVWDKAMKTTKQSDQLLTSENP